jgi:hypothetical protein
MKNRNYLIAGLIAASLMLISLSSQAQPTRRTVTVNGQVLPVPDDASTGTARAVVGITIPVLPSDICTGSNRNCFNPQNAPINNGASGSQCGWIGIYNGYLGSRVPCNGNTLGMGNVANCPAGYGPGDRSSGFAAGSYQDYTGQCIKLEQIAQGDGCGQLGSPPCYSISTSPLLSYSYIPVGYWTQVSNWNCPSSYTFTQMISGSGSGGNDTFWTCIKS